MLPESGTFTTACLADGSPAPGLNLVIEGEDPIQLAPEATNIGYCAGQFGSIVKMDDGTYLVGWLSRGIRANSQPREALKNATDIAIVRLSADRKPSGPITWIHETENLAETNLHLARYGDDRLLVVWDSIENISCSMTTCFGTYAGTYARLIDVGGNSLSDDELITSPPSSGDDLVVYPNGDLGWAYVPDDQRNYEGALPADANQVPLVRAKREIRVARMRYCE
jgi:hypothetical protein